ncbi:hypothetical protein RFI_09293 [Reticulomyxa filosa]|uniref:Uncharacterized protein n=1 Tax=Reticulomyxa filosa TaxID=46433 RepID=X6NNH9_RETFI|nr:hypothetical protein RFI_09293 [Reticulomyxa filosa]|eukprot:ETO27840.1 hypothetical protein RFI_09293 [Reticulomyxa filosa]
MDIQKRFLTCQNVVQCQVVFSIVFLCIFHTLLCYLVIPNNGFEAAVWCNVISTFLYVLALHLYMVKFQPHSSHTFQCLHVVFFYLSSLNHIVYVTWTWKLAINWKSDHEEKNSASSLGSTKANSNEALEVKEMDEKKDVENDMENDVENDVENNVEIVTKAKIVENNPTAQIEKQLEAKDELGQSIVLERYAGLKGYVILALAGIGTQCNEWWSWEANSLLVGLLGTDTLAAHSIYVLIVSFAFMLPYGISIALSTRLGHLLGCHQFRLAKQVAIWGWCTPFFTTIFISIAILAATDPIARLFTPDPAVISIARSIAPFAAFFLLLDALQGVGQGILRGLSLQTKAVYPIIITAWFIGLPMAAVLAFACNLDLRGTWIGVTIGYFVMDISLFAIYCTYQWQGSAYHTF